MKIHYEFMSKKMAKILYLRILRPICHCVHLKAAHVISLKSRMRGQGHRDSSFERIDNTDSKYIFNKSRLPRGGAQERFEIAPWHHHRLQKQFKGTLSNVFYHLNNHF